MSQNRQTHYARAYHQATKHSPVSIRQDRHYLDWENKPAPFKRYPQIPPIELPTDLAAIDRPAFQAVASISPEASQDRVPSLDEIARLLYLTGGITKRISYQNGDIYFRAAACAGALYPIELYLVCGPLPGLEAGVYHFSPAKFSLRQLRSGDWRGYLPWPGGEYPLEWQVPAYLVFSAVTWRSSWKYQARAYRYHFWDCGTMLANSLAVAGGTDLPARILACFHDQIIQELLGLDGHSEKVLCLLALGVSQSPPPNDRELTTLEVHAEPDTSLPVEYPVLEQLHQTSYMTIPPEICRGNPSGASSAGRHSSTLSQPQNDPSGSDLPLEQVILQRGSTRRFRRSSLPSGWLDAILRAGSTPIPGDWSSAAGQRLNDIYLNLHAVDERKPGAYFFHRESGNCRVLSSGNYRGDSAHLCLGQELGGSSSFTVFYLCDLESAFTRFGNRAYRLAQLEAGIMGGRIYLLSYALGLGATGLTFFDDLVTDFFSPHAGGKEAIFVMAVGHPAGPGFRPARLQILKPGEFRG